MRLSRRWKSPRQPTQVAPKRKSKPSHEVVAFDAADSAYTINTLIMFICAVLVLFMQAGFAMVEVGLNSAKNTVNILAKNVMDLSVGVILFLFVGFALMYPGELDRRWVSGTAKCFRGTR